MTFVDFGKTQIRFVDCIHGQRVNRQRETFVESAVHAFATVVAQCGTAGWKTQRPWRPTSTQKSMSRWD